jgi:hypothetical protein
VNAPLTVVVPTFDRGPRLRATVESLLACDTGDLTAVEIIVVDDGSTPPAAPYLEGLTVPPPFSVRVIRQENAGVGGARNRGFRESAGDLVLFVDDDVLLDAGALLGHVAAHAERRDAVIFGDYPYAPGPDTPFSRWVSHVGFGAGVPTSGSIVASDIVASGHLSVERSMFEAEGRVYDDSLRTPVSEEWELTHRLSARGISILRATHLRGVHDRRVSLAAVCRNQYGHGVGCGEVALLRPETLALPALRRIVATHAPDAVGAPARAGTRVWNVLSRPGPRRALVAVAERAERHAVVERALPALYRLAVGAHFSAGVRDGLALARVRSSSSYSAS